MNRSLSRILTALLIILCAGSTGGQAQIINHYAGTEASRGWTGDGMPANFAQLNNPMDITTDPDGNIYIADMGNHAIRKIARNGFISTIAGSPGAGYSGDGGLAVFAKLSSPIAITTDYHGNIYIADLDNAVIRKIGTDGIISTFAGTGTAGYNGDGGQALAAELDLRGADMIADFDGNLLISHPESYVVRKIAPDGIITTIAGTGVQGYSGDDGPATDAEFKSPRFLEVEPGGTVYICDPKTFTIRKIDPNGIVTKYAGTQVNSSTGDGGLAINASLGTPYGIAKDNCNNLYIAEYNSSKIRKVNGAGVISTVAGTGTRGTGGDGGAAVAADLWYPMAITSDYLGHLLITDSYNDRIRSLSVDACNQVTIYDPGPICTLNADRPISYSTNPGCSLEPLWTFDPAHIQFVSAANGQGIFQFLKAGRTWLVASINTDCNTYDDTLWLQVDEQPAALALGNDTTICPGVGILLNAGNNYVQYIWQDGSSETTFLAKTEGSYTVYVSNTCGELSSDEITISTVNMMELFTMPSVTACANDSFYIDAEPSYGNYKWLPAMNVTAQGPTARAMFANDQAVILEAVGPLGCAIKDTLLVQLNHAAPINLGADTALCFNDHLVLQAGTGYQSYLWSDGSANTSLTINEPGNFHVAVQDEKGCYARDTIMISRYNKISVNLGKDRNICSNETIRLEPGRFNTYLWQDGSTNADYLVNKNGKYWVSVIDENYCSTSDTLVIHNLYTAPGSFLLPADTICAGRGLDIVTPGSYSKYLWSNGSTSSRITISRGGTYDLTVTDQNGCRATESIKVVEKDCRQGVFMPNAFSPNRDGRNDLFKALVHGPIARFQIVVYNRYGEIVFSTNDPLKAWDGVYKGVPSPTGNYIWKCVYQLQGENVMEQKGQILLLR
jgi:gliding motility-associated-like protein